MSDPKTTFPEHSMIRLRHTISRDGYRIDAGTFGTVVHIYAHARAYEVEFSADVCVTLAPDDIEAAPAPRGLATLE